MIVTRYLALAALVSVLPLGCSQSLFDANLGDGPGPGPGPGPGGDGGADLPDARMGGGDPDAAPPPTTCPDPCTANAFRDFRAVQNDPWRYVEVRPDDPHGTGYDDMTLLVDTPPWWIGAGSPTAAASIASCAGTEHVACGDQTDLLVLSAAQSEPEANYPALLWSVEETASYRLLGSWRMPEQGMTIKRQDMHLARNSQFDYVERQREVEPDKDWPFDVTIDALRGDVISLSAPGQTASAPGQSAGVLGLRFYISQQPGPGSCRTAIDFTGADPFSNRCGSGTFVDSTPATADAAAPPGIPGSARQFAAGSSLTYDGAPNDYSGDWTVQFWAMLDAGGSGDQWLLSDLDCANKGGLGVRYDGTMLHVTILDRESEVTKCEPSALPSKSFDAPASGEWHFFRITRAFNPELAVQRVTPCMDGVLKTVAITGRDMTTTEPLALGRVATLPAEFVGRIADLRVFTRALPCEGG